LKKKKYIYIWKEILKKPAVLCQHEGGGVSIKYENKSCPSSFFKHANVVSNAKQTWKNNRLLKQWFLLCVYTIKTRTVVCCRVFLRLLWWESRSPIKLIPCLLTAGTKKTVKKDLHLFFKLRMRTYGCSHHFYKRPIFRFFKDWIRRTGGRGIKKILFNLVKDRRHRGVVPRGESLPLSIYNLAIGRQSEFIVMTVGTPSTVFFFFSSLYFNCSLGRLILCWLDCVGLVGACCSSGLYLSLLIRKLQLGRGQGSQVGELLI